MTGDPKRQCTIPQITRTGGKVLRFAFDQLKFPACKGCNSSFSELEGYAKRHLKAVLSEQPLDAAQWSLLLDWFDKVRIGLWHGCRFLDKAAFSSSMPFSITKMLAGHDRGLVLHRSGFRSLGLTFFGCNTPMFQGMPTAFFLRVNNYCFINIAKENLVSRQLGFPYFTDTKNVGNGVIVGSLQEGTERVSDPILRLAQFPGAVSVWQHVISRGLHLQSPETRSLYSTDYVAKHMLIERLSVPFVERQKLETFPIMRPTRCVPTPIPLAMNAIEDALMPKLFKLQHDLWRHEIPAFVEEASRTRYSTMLKAVDIWFDAAMSSRRL